MGGISFTAQGDWSSTSKWLQRLADNEIFATLERYGDMGVSALAANTPFDTGETSRGWSYEIVQDSKSWSIIWSNSHVVAGTPVAILLQYGHGTGTGGYVEGIDFINPALQPLFDSMAEEAWKVVTSS